MDNLSLIEKIKILMNMVVSSPLFLSCFSVAIFLLIVYIICIKKDKQINKWIFISIWIILLLLLLINYFNIILIVIDNLFDALFMALYFPNLYVYLSILIITNTAFICSLIKKNIKKAYKITNFVISLILDVFLVLIVDTINTNSIDIMETITIYTNSYLLVLLQLTSALFVSWLLILLLISAKEKLKKYDVKTNKKPEIIFEDL